MALHLRPITRRLPSLTQKCDLHPSRRQTDGCKETVVGDVRIAQMHERAFENVIGIAVTSYPAPRCDGHSFAVDTTGKILVMADERPGLVVATSDLSELR
jgi:hypothetical protein